MMKQQPSLELIERPPRIQPNLPEGTHPIPAPPTIETRTQPLLQLALPLVTVLGYLLMSFSGASRNFLIMLPMSLAMLFSFYIAYTTYKNEQKRQKMLRQQYRQQLDTLRLEMNRWHHNQRQFYMYNYPAIDDVLKLTQSNHYSRLGIRLWERRWEDDDFGAIRLGLGNVPSRVIYELGNANDTSDPFLRGLAQQLAEDSQVVSDAPILWHLRPSPNPDDPQAPRARFSVGIVGKEKAHVYNVATAYVVQYVAFHAPSDAHLFVIGPSSAQSDWLWATWLPHTNSQTESYEGDRMVFADFSLNPTTDLSEQDKEQKRKITVFWESLKKNLDARRARLADKDSHARATSPFLLVVVDMLTADKQPIPEWLLEIPSIDSASLIMTEGDRLGAAILFLTTDATKIPSDCQAVIEVEQTGATNHFYYSEVGNNTPRFIGIAEIAKPNKLNTFAEQLRDAYVRRRYDEELETQVSLLDLYDARSLDDIVIADNWKKITSKDPDWLRVRLGFEGGRKIFELYLQQDHDGVHGMIAGTTGSGKSELLLTLIAGLALTYPPDILNFLLIDYKGGTAFEPFADLPHVVDILTNLEGNVVERMFVALRAELSRRQSLLKSYGDSHIVDYHRSQREKRDNRPPLPFLFIVIDEFAEMVTQNNDYKAHFDSITRLGRALGVNLLLATQRPTGAVTDQMRSNIKYRICLRVETGDDSRELLGRSDAVFLPSNIPGRAYVQSGNLIPKLVQMAYTGGEYKPDEQRKQLSPIIDLDKSSEATIPQTDASFEPNDVPTYLPATDDFATASVSTDIPTDQTPPAKPKKRKVIQELVARIAETAHKANYPRQYKPWPNPLPSILPINLPIDAYYIESNTDTITTRLRDGQFILNHYINHWMLYDGNPMTLPKAIEQWHEGYYITDWDKQALRAEMGLVDLPHKGKQHILTIDLTRGPLVLFGASGWGKTTFIYSLLISLATTHTPHELQIYAIGRSNLDVVKNLPHLGRPIEITEQRRIERLLRVLSNHAEARNQKLANYSSLAHYNRENPTDILPALLLIIDNYADFRDSYEQLQDQLITLIRAGRSVGMYFVFTADQLTALPTNLLNLFTQRLTLKLADASTYADIVGRGAISLTETSGRGFITLPERNPKDRIPLEFQVGVPCVVVNKQNQWVKWDELPQIFNMSSKEDTLYATLDKLSQQDAKDDHPYKLHDFNTIYTQICDNMNQLWGERPRPAPIEALEIDLTLEQVQALAPYTISIGLRDSDRKPLTLSFSKRESHLLIIGTPLSGKTTTLQTLILALANCYTPDEAAFIFIDPQEDLFNYGGEFSLGQLPHVLQVVSNMHELDDLATRLKAEFEPPIREALRQSHPTLINPSVSPKRRLFIFIDHYENRDTFMQGFSNAHLDQLAEWVGQYRKLPLHITLAVSEEAYRNNRDNLIRKLETLRHILTLQISDLGAFGVRLSARHVSKEEFPLGRGFLLKGEYAELVQIARPYKAFGTNVETQIIKELDEQVAALKARHVTPAQWYFTGEVALIRQLTDSSTSSTSSHTTVEKVSVSDYTRDIIEQIRKGD